MKPFKFYLLLLVIAHFSNCGESWSSQRKMEGLTQNQLLEKAHQCKDDDHDCCIDYLEKYLEKNSSDPRARNNLSICYNNRGVSWPNEDWKKAIADYNKAIRYNPNNVKPIIDKAIEYHNQRDFDNAIGTGESIVNEDMKEKSKERLYVVLMLSFENTSRFFEALEYSKLGERLFPDNDEFAEARKRVNQLNGNRVPAKPRWKVETERTTRELIQDYRNVGNASSIRKRLGILRDPDADKNSNFFDKQIENTIVPLVAQESDLFSVIHLNKKDFLDTENFLAKPSLNNLQADLLLRIEINRQDRNVLITIKLKGEGGRILSQRGVTVQEN